MAITVNKKKLTLRTAKTVPAEPLEAGAGFSAAPMSFAVQEKTPSYVAYGVLGILAFLMFAGLLFIQWLEWSEFNRPGVFPVLRSEAFVSASGETTVQPAGTPAAAEDETKEQSGAAADSATSADDAVADDLPEVE